MSKAAKPFQRIQAAELARRLAEPRRFIQVVEGARQVGKTTLVQQATVHRRCGQKPRIQSQTPGAQHRPAVYYWRERNHEVAFVVKAGRRLTAIEVQSARAPFAHPGLFGLRGRLQATACSSGMKGSLSRSSLPDPSRTGQGDDRERRPDQAYSTSASCKARSGLMKLYCVLDPSPRGNLIGLPTHLAELAGRARDAARSVARLALTRATNFEAPAVRAACRSSGALLGRSRPDVLISVERRTCLCDG